MESFRPKNAAWLWPSLAWAWSGAIIGPLLGGWITDRYSWRWVFYVNIPFGILAVLMCQAFGRPRLPPRP